MATASDPSDKQSRASAGAGSVNDPLGGLRFNQTGREETAREVLRPQRDPAAQKRAAGIIALVILGMLALGVISFARSGLKLSDVTRTDQGPQFGPQGGNPDQARDETK